MLRRELKVCNITSIIIWTRKKIGNSVFEEYRAIRVFLKATVIQMNSITMFKTRNTFLDSNLAAVKSYWPWFFSWKKISMFYGVL